MNPEDIDDLFRQQLDGHASPPSDDLWARLQLPSSPAETDTEPLDTLFRAGLHGHATPPRRELWERLEDEHLRPQPRRKRRVAAWWQYSAAAVLLLLLLAGGAGLWRGAMGSEDRGLTTAHPRNAPVAQQPLAPAKRSVSTLADQASATTLGSSLADQPLAQVAPASASKKNRQIFSPQATAPQTSTSSTPMATTTQSRRAAAAARAAGSHRQQPDAAAGYLASGQRRPAGQSPTTPQTVDNNVATNAPDPILAVASPATAAPEIIEVDVRRGPAPTSVAAPVVLAVADATPTPPRRRLRLGGLLRQADHLVHGESVNLAEATNLPESVTLQAHLGGRLISKTIRL
jgi:hypothetical protein